MERRLQGVPACNGRAKALCDSAPQQAYIRVSDASVRTSSCRSRTLNDEQEASPSEQILTNNPIVTVLVDALLICSNFGHSDRVRKEQRRFDVKHDLRRYFSHSETTFVQKTPG